MEISLHFLSRNSPQNASSSPCTRTTSLSYPVAVATFAGFGPSGSSIGMCHDSCPGIAYCDSRRECGGVCDRCCLPLYHIRVAWLSRALHQVKWPLDFPVFWARGVPLVDTTASIIVPLDTGLLGGTFKDPLASGYTPLSQDHKVVARFPLIIKIIYCYQLVIPLFARYSAA